MRQHIQTSYGEVEVAKGGFKGEAPKDKKDKEFVLNVNYNEIDKLIEEYKRIKKVQKSNMNEIQKLSGKKTEVERLIDNYGIDEEALE